MAERLGFDRVLHMLRNPYGFKAEELRRAHLEAADRLEGLQDAYLNMRNWAEQNGLDTVARAVRPVTRLWRGRRTQSG